MCLCGFRSDTYTPIQSKFIYLIGCSMTNSPISILCVEDNFVSNLYLLQHEDLSLKFGYMPLHHTLNISQLAPYICTQYSRNTSYLHLYTLSQNTTMEFSLSHFVFISSLLSPLFPLYTISSYSPHKNPQFLSKSKFGPPNHRPYAAT